MIKEVAKKRNKIKLEKIIKGYNDNINMLIDMRIVCVDELNNGGKNNEEIIIMIDNLIDRFKRSITKVKKENRKMEVTIKSNNELWNKILNDYKDYVVLKYSYRKNNIPYSILPIQAIYFERKTILNPRMFDIYNLLHEIGHVMTNDEGMEVVKKEYLATQWSINMYSKYNIKIQKCYIKQFQNYIYTYLDQNDTEYNIKKELYKLNVPDGILF